MGLLRDCEIVCNTNSTTSPVPECGDVVPRPVQQGPHQPRLARHQLRHRRGLVEEARRRARGQLRGHGLHAPPRQPLHAEQAGVDSVNRAVNTNLREVLHYLATAATS